MLDKIEEAGSDKRTFYELLGGEDVWHCQYSPTGRNLLRHYG